MDRVFRLDGHPQACHQRGGRSEPDGTPDRSGLAEAAASAIEPAVADRLAQTRSGRRIRLCAGRVRAG
jgi:hypothetical protein